MTNLVAVPVGREKIAAIHARELPQKDMLCGCFWGAVILGAAGVDRVDQDRVAEHTGTTLPEGDSAGDVPPGEAPRRDYRIALPRAADPAEAGTAAPALARAIEELTEGKLAVVPIAGPWNAESVGRLFEAAAAAPEATLLANVRTGPFWGTRAHPSLLLDYLEGKEVEAPPHEWDVGHFVNLAALVRGPGGSLVVVRDSYRSLGWEGHHLQPATAIARALARGDGREGGVLCVASAAGAGSLEASLLEAGFVVRHWDNGTPERVRAGQGPARI